MSRTLTRSAWIRLLVALTLLALLPAATACTASTTQSSSGSVGPSPSDKQASQEKPAPEEPKPTSWTVYINDDDSYSAGGMTYKIAVNFTATNPSSDPAGKYTGNATASTSTEGNVGGANLSAQAIAQSGQLSFTLEDPSAGGALAPLNDEKLPDLSGSGTITMKAAGSASVGPAGGSFSNTSSQKLDIKTTGSKVTLSVVISGHKYTFDGTISGK